MHKLLGLHYLLAHIFQCDIRIHKCEFFRGNTLKRQYKFLALIFIPFIAWTIAYAMEEVAGNKEYSWRYKMTVEIETPEGIKTGSAVREMNLLFEPRPLYKPHPYHVSFKMQGEAVVVDLGERGVVFVLVTSSSYPEVTNNIAGPAPLTIKGAEYYSALKDEKASLQPGKYPKIVTFKNINDPKSVALVQGYVFDPETQESHLEDHFEELFGEGVKIKNISVEMTDEPVTWGVVDAYLPSKLQELKENWRDLPYSEKQRINNLISFKTGEPK